MNIYIAKQHREAEKPENLSAFLTKNRHIYPLIPQILAGTRRKSTENPYTKRKERRSIDDHLPDYYPDHHLPCRAPFIYLTDFYSSHPSVKRIFTEIFLITSPSAN